MYKEIRSDKCERKNITKFKETTLPLNLTFSFLKIFQNHYQSHVRVSLNITATII